MNGVIYTDQDRTTVLFVNNKDVNEGDLEKMIKPTTTKLTIVLQYLGELNTLMLLEFNKLIELKIFALHKYVHSASIAQCLLPPQLRKFNSNVHIGLINLCDCKELRELTLHCGSISIPTLPKLEKLCLSKPVEAGISWDTLDHAVKHLKIIVDEFHLHSFPIDQHYEFGREIFIKTKWLPNIVKWCTCLETLEIEFVEEAKKPEGTRMILNLENPKLKELIIKNGHNSLLFVSGNNDISLVSSEGNIKFI
jgi:hypothetical protein